MHLLTRIKRRFLVSAPISYLIRKSKQIFLPGFQGIPLFDVIRFFFLQAKKLGFTERASAIAFNFTMTIPPAVIFLFTLLPYLPISKNFISEMFTLIRDVVPGEKNNAGLIKFLEDMLDNPRTGLLSIGFLLAMFFSSNAVMGIMRSFDRQFIGFVQRREIHQRWIAIRLTFILLVLFILCISALIMQGAVLRWLGVRSSFLIFIIHNLRWVLIVLLFLFSISIIYRYAPGIQKKMEAYQSGVHISHLPDHCFYRRVLLVCKQFFKLQ